MLFRSLALLATGIAVFVSNVGIAHPGACYWDVYRPGALQAFIAQNLPIIGMSAVPQGSVTFATPKGASLLVRDGQIAGVVHWTQDARRGASILTVYDMSQLPLFRATESEAVCNDGTHPGVCQGLEIGFEQQPDDGFGNSPFSAVLVPGDALPTYFRYGVAVDLADWRHDLLDAFSWLNGTLLSLNNLNTPLLNAPAERVFWSLAADPLVIPYLDRLQLVTHDGHLVGLGVMPSFYVFDAVVGAALAAGYPDFQPLMIIDTGTALPLADADSLTSCFY